MMKSLLCDISANQACSKPKAEMQFTLEGIALVFCISCSYQPTKLMHTTRQDQFDIEENNHQNPAKCSHQSH